MSPAFVQSPARSFASFVADGGRDPRRDPQSGDEVGRKLPTMHRVLVVEDVKRGRVRGRAVASDLTTRGSWRGHEEAFEVEIAAWRAANEHVSVFVVAAS